MHNFKKKWKLIHGQAQPSPWLLKGWLDWASIFQSMNYMWLVPTQFNPCLQESEEEVVKEVVGGEICNRIGRCHHWLGTFDMVEEVAHSFDDAVRRLRGIKAMTNFEIPLVLPMLSLISSSSNSSFDVKKVIGGHNHKGKNVGKIKSVVWWPLWLSCSLWCLRLWERVYHIEVKNDGFGNNWS